MECEREKAAIWSNGESNGNEHGTQTGNWFYKVDSGFPKLRGPLFGSTYNKDACISELTTQFASAAEFAVAACFVEVI